MKIHLQLSINHKPLIIRPTSTIAPWKTLMFLKRCVQNYDFSVLSVSHLFCVSSCTLFPQWWPREWKEEKCRLLFQVYRDIGACVFVCVPVSYSWDKKTMCGYIWMIKPLCLLALTASLICQLCTSCQRHGLNNMTFLKWNPSASFSKVFATQPV